MKKTVLAAVALMGVVGINQVSAGNGDLYLGFEATDGIGKSVNLVFNLGSAVNFSSINSNIGADIAATYGANWFSRTDLFWGVIGAVKPALGIDPVNTLYASDATGTGAWNRASTSSQSLVAAKLASLQLQIETDIANNQVGVNTAVVFMQNTTETSAWGSFTSIGASSFGSFNGSIETSVINNLDLYRLTPGTGSGSNFGSLNLSSTGTISAVPEPSTYALMGFGVLLLVIAYRRKSNA